VIFLGTCSFYTSDLYFVDKEKISQTLLKNKRKVKKPLEKRKLVILRGKIQSRSFCSGQNDRPGYGLSANTCTMLMAGGGLRHQALDKRNTINKRS
jgi:hypothetical protein